MKKLLYLRKADIDDMLLLFEWANNSAVRNNAFNSEPILLERHTKWYYNLLSDPNRYQYILMLGEKPIGQIRLDCAEDFAEIDYSISSEFRNKGYGAVLLDLIKEEVKTKIPKVTRLIAKVKTGNKASEACFLKSRFDSIYSCFEYRIERE